MSPAPTQRPKIFISYRREDSGPSVRALATELEQSFGPDAAFLDLDSIRPGVDFAAEIRQQLAAVQVVLVVIGNEWLEATDSRGQRRLLNPQDLVRLEIEEALRLSARSGHTPLVIPVLIDDANPPPVDRLPASLRHLQRLHGARLRSTDWHHDIGRLVEVIRPWVQPTPALATMPRTTRPTRSQSRRRSGGQGIAVLVAIVAFAAIVAGVVYGGSRLFDSLPDDLLVSQDVDLSPSSGPPGTEVEVTATGFPPGGEVRFQAFFSQKGDVVVADAEGTAVWRVVLEGGFGPNTERITADGEDNSDNASATFVYTG